MNNETKYLNNILLIDGSHMLTRALLQPAFRNFKSKDGKNSGGVYGFITMLESAVKKFSGYYPICVWDCGHSKRRLMIYPNYKHDAEKIKGTFKSKIEDTLLNDLPDQKEAIRKYLEAVRIPNIILQDWEADDLIYLLTKKCNKCVIVTDDKDYIQLTSPTCTIYRGIAKDIIKYETIQEEYKYPRYEYYKAITGDPSDNLPGVVEGIGKTGANVIAKIMSDFVNKAQCSPLDFRLIFNYLTIEKDSEEIQSQLKTCRGLTKKFDNFLASGQKFFELMTLIDFNFVEEPENFKTLIESQIIPVLNSKPQIMECFKIKGAYGLVDADPNEIMAKLAASNSVLIK